MLLQKNARDFILSSKRRRNFESRMFEIGRYIFFLSESPVIWTPVNQATKITISNSNTDPNSNPKFCPAVVCRPVGELPRPPHTLNCAVSLNSSRAAVRSASYGHDGWLVASGDGSLRQNWPCHVSAVIETKLQSNSRNSEKRPRGPIMTDDLPPRNTSMQLDAADHRKYITGGHIWEVWVIRRTWIVA